MVFALGEKQSNEAPSSEACGRVSKDEGLALMKDFISQRMSHSCSPASPGRWRPENPPPRAPDSPSPGRSSGARQERSIRQPGQSRRSGAAQGVDRQRDIFSPTPAALHKGLPPITLMWGARAWANPRWWSVHSALAEGLKLIEIIARILGAAALLGALARALPLHRLCDDLSFDPETSYKALKTALEGGVEGRPDVCCFTPVRSPPSVPAT
jgi:hypothetical protein